MEWLFLAAVLTGAAWFWRSQGVREVALAAARGRCRAEDLALLDDSVALRRLWLKRDIAGQPRIWRAWEFEFTVTGEHRYAGRVLTLGRAVEAVLLPPYRIAHPPPDRVH